MSLTKTKSANPKRKRSDDEDHDGSDNETNNTNNEAENEAPKKTKTVKSKPKSKAPKVPTEEEDADDVQVEKPKKRAASKKSASAGGKKNVKGVASKVAAADENVGDDADEKPKKKRKRVTDTQVKQAVAVLKDSEDLNERQAHRDLVLAALAENYLAVKRAAAVAAGDDAAAGGAADKKQRSKEKFVMSNERKAQMVAHWNQKMFDSCWEQLKVESQSIDSKPIFVSYQFEDDAMAVVMDIAKAKGLVNFDTCHPKQDHVKAYCADSKKWSAIKAALSEAEKKTDFNNRAVLLYPPYGVISKPPGLGRQLADAKWKAFMFPKIESKAKSSTKDEKAPNEEKPASTSKSDSNPVESSSSGPEKKPTVSSSAVTPAVPLASEKKTQAAASTSEKSKVKKEEPSDDEDADDK